MTTPQSAYVPTRVKNRRRAKGLVARRALRSDPGRTFSGPDEAAAYLRKHGRPSV